MVYAIYDAYGPGVTKGTVLAVWSSQTARTVPLVTNPG